MSDIKTAKKPLSVPDSDTQAEYYIETIIQNDDVDAVVTVLVGDKEGRIFVQRNDKARFGDDDYDFPGDEAGTDEGDSKAAALLGFKEDDTESVYDDFLTPLFEYNGIFDEIEALEKQVLKAI